MVSVELRGRRKHYALRFFLSFCLDQGASVVASRWPEASESPGKRKSVLAKEWSSDGALGVIAA